MTQYQDIQEHLSQNQYGWLITGVAGFIGSNLLEALLKLDQKVVGLDNFSTGHQHNLDQVKEIVGTQAWAKFDFIKGDILALSLVLLLILPNVAKIPHILFPEITLED